MVPRIAVLPTPDRQSSAPNNAQHAQYNHISSAFRTISTSTAAAVVGSASYQANTSFLRTVRRLASSRAASWALAPAPLPAACTLQGTHPHRCGGNLAAAPWNVILAVPVQLLKHFARHRSFPTTLLFSPPFLAPHARILCCLHQQRHRPTAHAARLAPASHAPPFPLSPARPARAFLHASHRSQRSCPACRPSSCCQQPASRGARAVFCRWTPSSSGCASCCRRGSRTWSTTSRWAW